MAAHPAAERLIGRFDVLHFSDWMYPPQRGGVRATTIHDLVPLHHPEWTTPRTRSMHGRKYRNAAETCDVVFVNSEFTGRDVIETLGVSAERVRVARPAAKEVFRPDGPAADLGAPYILTVATLEPRKNLQTLVEAHRLLGGDILLAVVGAEGWGEQPLLDDPRIRRLGYVSDEELARLYRGAAVAVYPSRFEGFGIPVIEAMACGVPVVVSSHESLDEASGARGRSGGSRRSRGDRRGDRARARRAGAAGRRRARARAELHLARGRRDLPARLRGGCAPMRPEEVLLVVFRPGPEFLVLLRSPERHGYWNLVAGGVEEGRGADRGCATRARRGVRSRAARFASSRSLWSSAYVRPEGSKVAMHAFLAEAPPGWEPVLNEEHVEYRWCSLADADALLAYPEPREAVRCVARLLEAGAA